jgi:pimeloyl-ACP methyl ester carboxylesterase
MFEGRGGDHMTSYRGELRMAWRRVNAFPPHKLQTRFGNIDYITRGDGVPLLVSHGVLGSHVEAVDGWWAELPGPGFRVIGPSRFGYFGSAIPPKARPADQADAFALLLDRVSVDRAVVIAYSAGSGAALEFALRHPERTIGLVLCCCRLGGGLQIPDVFKPLVRFAYGADWLFWIFKTLLPDAYSRVMGIPKGFRPSSEAAAIVETRKLLFPFRPRRDGAVFDGYVSNPTADAFPFERLVVPALVINAKDDPLAPYEFALTAAERIPGARFVSIESGGHFFMGHDDEVRKSIGLFVQELT